MAFQVGSDEDHVLADINVTPLVDVMLVLLIIFMITAPMLHQGIEVDLPQSEAEAMQLAVEDPIVLSINREGLVYLADQPIHPTLLIERLLPVLKSRSDKTVFLKGDSALPYGKVMELLDLLHQGGITTVGMVTEKPSAKEKP